MKKIILISICIVLTLNFVLADELYVNFNGDFEEGAVLYSNWYNGTSNIYGKDAYPNRSTIFQETICTNETINYMEPVCVLNTTYVTRLVRIRHGYNVTYENRTIARTTRECHSENRNRIVQSCRRVRTRIGCLNPGGACGLYTNQLKLAGNFFYSTDGTNWINMTYGNIHLNNESVRFKVQIPSICTPSYTINRAIIVE